MGQRRAMQRRHNNNNNNNNNKNNNINSSSRSRCSSVGRQMLKSRTRCTCRAASHECQDFHTLSGICTPCASQASAASMSPSPMSTRGLESPSSTSSRRARQPRSALWSEDAVGSRNNKASTKGATCPKIGSKSKLLALLCAIPSGVISTRRP
ncbi:unnamed protein product [Polarella glacialis]|nr:unnamed protein product [Polarella glacialis]